VPRTTPGAAPVPSMTSSSSDVDSGGGSSMA
jgi:hypothetical protein